jgi:hypothetical protein
LEEAEIHYEGQNIKATLSGGLASFPIDASDGLSLLKNADKAMYRAKSFGKNNISFYSMNKRRNIRVEYTTAVEIQELGIHVKPAFTATTKSLSIGGILLESNEHLETGTKIQITIPISQENPLLLIGNVVRSEKTVIGSNHISVAFIDSSIVVKNEISSYLIRHLKDTPDHSAKTIQPAS